MEMATVILAEKPDQAKQYAEAFKKCEKKNGYYEINDGRFFKGTAYLTYGYGHLVELADPSLYKDEWKNWSLDTLPMIPKKYKFVVKKKGEKQYSIVKRLLDHATDIIIATDCDREGENIARSIIAKSGNAGKPVKRLWINSLEKEEITRGFSNLKEGQEFYSSYKEAQTRQISDWLVGINITRLYSLLLQKQGLKGVFSVGRVQTPTLYMIYKRHKDIKEFKPEPFFEILAGVHTDKGDFTCKYDQRFKTAEEVKELFQKHQIQQRSPAVIKMVKTEGKQTQSPKLFSLSDLQSKANKLYKMSPAETLKTVQSLYEAKLLSYPRTDCNYITNAEFNYLKNGLQQYISFLGVTNNDLQLEPKKRYVNNEKVQEHYAIIPTKKVPNKNIFGKLSKDQQIIYTEVLKNTIAMFFPDYKFEQTTIIVDINGLDFKASGKVEVSKGWKMLFNEEKETEKPLPAVKEGEKGIANITPKKGVTTPPKLYTEGQLITLMKTAGKVLDEAEEEAKKILNETEGIGTEATRANIIETLKKQDYITVKKNTVNITEKGIILCESLTESKLSSPAFTAEWETYLKKIRKNQGTQERFLQGIENFVAYLVKEAPRSLEKGSVTQAIENIKAENVIGKCPFCEGNITDKGKFYGCSNYSNGCKFTIPKVIASKNISAANVKRLLKGVKTNLIKGFKSKKGKSFDAYLMLEDGNVRFHFDNKN